MWPRLYSYRVIYTMYLVLSTVTQKSTRLIFYAALLEVAPSHRGVGRFFRKNERGEHTPLGSCHRAPESRRRALRSPPFSFNAAVVPDLPNSRLSKRGLSLRCDLAVAAHRRRWWCIHELSTLLDGSASPLVCRFYFWSKEESAASDFNVVHWWC